MGQRRETWVTWAGPGHGGGSGRAPLVTARARQQLMYAGHRKAELRRHHSLWDLCVVLTWSQGCFPASSFIPFTNNDPRLYGQTISQQRHMPAIYKWRDTSGAGKKKKEILRTFVTIWCCFSHYCCFRNREQAKWGWNIPLPFWMFLLLCSGKQAISSLRRAESQAPPKCIVFVTQPALGVRLCAREGWCSSARTPTSRCVNPAPPVARSGTACAIHTSSVGMSLLGLSKPSCISHSPSHHIRGGQYHNYRSSRIRET